MGFLAGPARTNSKFSVPRKHFSSCGRINSTRIVLFGVKSYLVPVCKYLVCNDPFRHFGGEKMTKYIGDYSTEHKKQAARLGGGQFPFRFTIQSEELKNI